jgi:DNA-binding MarR family transcriptional regulator
VLEFDFQNSIGLWICSAAHAVRRAMDRELREQGVTFRQWEVLACLALKIDTQAKLADRLGIEAATLVGVLTRMEEGGWLVREGCEVDRRVKRIRPTPQAEQLWATMTDCAMRVRAQLSEGLSPDELTQLKQLCNRVQQNLEGVLEESPTGVARRELITGSGRPISEGGVK